MLVTGHDDTCLQWLHRRWPDIGRPPQMVWGLTDADGVLGGAIPLWQENAWTWEVGLYSEGVIRPRDVRWFFWLMFNRLQADRLQMKTQRANKKMRKLAPKLGWTFEGISKSYYGEHGDAICFGMTPATCRWIKTHEISAKAP